MKLVIFLLLVCLLASELLAQKYAEIILGDLYHLIFKGSKMRKYAT